jgi:hypothetical protein
MSVKSELAESQEAPRSPASDSTKTSATPILRSGGTVDSEDSISPETTPVTGVKPTSSAKLPLPTITPPHFSAFKSIPPPPKHASVDTSGNKLSLVMMSSVKPVPALAAPPPRVALPVPPFTVKPLSFYVSQPQKPQSLPRPAQSIIVETNGTIAAQKDTRKRKVEDEQPHDVEELRIPRPRNAFMIMACEFRPKVQAQYPNTDNKLISQHLGNLWKAMDPSTRALYAEKAAQEKESHKVLHLDTF